MRLVSLILSLGQFANFTDLAEARADGDLTADIYSIKNEDLRLSLLIGAAYRGAVHFQVLNNSASNKWNQRRVLDVGCDNGLLTCFYALLWPDSSIVGIDPCPDAIRNAKQLAAHLEISNIEFLTTSLSDFSSSVTKGSFGRLITTTVLHEAGYFEALTNDRHFLEDAFNSKGPVDSVEITQIARNLLETGGQWTSAEMLQTPHLFWQLCRVLNASGFSIRSERSARIKCDDDLLTILFIETEASHAIEADTALQIWLGPGYKYPVRPIIGQPEFFGIEAVLTLKAIEQKTKVANAFLWPDDDDRPDREWERVEIWTANGLAMLFRSNANANALLRVVEVSELGLLVGEWNSIIEGYRESGRPNHSMIDPSIRGS